jgi:hypothetical protein
MNTFVQGVDPYETMKIGSNRPAEVGDKYKSLYALDWVPDTLTSLQRDEPRSSHWAISKDDFVFISVNSVMTIEKINSSYAFSELNGVVMKDSNMFVSYEDLDKFFKRL